MRRILPITLIILTLLAFAIPSYAQGGDRPTTHTVQPGENLFRIALQYGVSVEALMEANGLTDADIVLSGQILTIPAGGIVWNAPPPAPVSASTRTHTVAAGETLTQIARQYNVTVEALITTNDLTTPGVIVPGQTLLIPATATADIGLIGVSVDFDPIQLPVEDLGIVTASDLPAMTVPDSSDTPAPAPENAPLPVMPVADETTDESSPDEAPAALETAPESETLPQAAEPETAVVQAASPDDLGILPPDASLSSATAATAPETESDTAPLSDAPVPESEPDTSPAPAQDLGILPPDTASWLLQPGIISTGGPDVRTIYLRGLQLGNNPHAFSKIGDCNSEPPFFLTKFDTGEYDLGPYESLEPVIDHFAGSFARESVAAWTGNHAWALFDPVWANPAVCLPGETPLACEFRLNRPSAVLIRLGTNEAGSPDLFEQYMRQIIDFAIERGVVPILGTKADRIEGSDRNNEIVRALAAEYGLPLWDFGRIADTIPGRGLREDGFHLTWYPLQFGDPRALQSGHAVHNLSALVALDRVWRSAMY